MYLDQNNAQYKQIQDFEKYARFICETFDINIQLEASLAETDGKTIYLPNIMSLTAKELDMMYAILLHEVGHIRYTVFTKENFAKLKTQHHAFLANAIEDARIENLLIKDFGGAQEIFTKLYTDYTDDKQLMKKVFRHSGKRPDSFSSLAFYIHNQLVDCQTSTLDDICGKYKGRVIKKFIQENNIDNLLLNAPLKNWDDVVNLTNKVFDLFLKTRKDRSAKLTIKEDIKVQEQIQKKMDELSEKVKQAQEQSDELNLELVDLMDQLENFFENNKAEIDNIKNDLQDNQLTKNKIDSEIDHRNKKSNLENKIIQSNGRISDVKQRIEKLETEISALENKKRNNVNGHGKPLTELQKDKLKSSLENKETQLKKNEEMLQKRRNDVAESENELDSLNNQPSGQFSSNTDESLRAKQEQLKDKITALTKQLSDILSKQGELESKILKKEEQIDNLTQQMQEETAKSMFNIDKMLNEKGFDGVDIVPPLNYQESWPEAGEVQNKFDEKATNQTGKIVRNGGKAAGQFGSNLRDILTFIDKKKEKVKEIDVAAIFKDKIQVSKFEDFNNTRRKTNQREDNSVIGTFGTFRKHLPLTTMFDTITNKNVSNKYSDLQKIKQSNHQFIQKLKQVFLQKFRFAKKDHWKGGQEEGNFDVRDLWKLPTKMGDDFYETNNPKFINKAAATILIDISGSNDKDITDHGEKLKLMALALSEALDQVHIKHEVLGYHAPLSEEMRSMQATQIYTRRSNKLDTVVYKTFQQKDKLGIMNLELQMTDNSDGESVRIACKRLLQERAKSYMLFVIGDGKPFLSDTDISVLDEDLRTALREAVHRKIKVFGLGFFEQSRDFFGSQFGLLKTEFDLVNFFEKGQF